MVYLSRGLRKFFFIELPLQIAKAPEEKPTSEQQQIVNFLPLRVLVAEDVHINRIVVLKILKSIGVTQIEIAEDGLQAVAKVSETAFDFVLMDIQMPHMDGIEATREINRYFAERGKKPPVIIAVTANATREDEEACKQAGMVEFITKPFSRKTLAEVIQRHCATPD